MLRNNLKIAMLSTSFIISGMACFQGSAPVPYPSFTSVPAPLSTPSTFTTSPCAGSGYYSDSPTCQTNTGKTCSVLVLNLNGASYACYSVASNSTSTNSPVATPVPTPVPTVTNTDYALCAANGGAWSAVPTTNNVYGCKYSGSSCGSSYNKMFAADFGSTTCNAPSKTIVQSTKKDGGKLCHNDWDGAVFKWRCTDNDPNHVKAECTVHIEAMNSNFFQVGTATFQGTYVFPSSSTNVQYPPVGGSIQCYTKLYCNQNTTVGGWGNCNMAWGTACWPDFNTNWLQDSLSNDSTTIKSTVQSVYCSKN